MSFICPSGVWRRGVREEHLSLLCLCHLWATPLPAAFHSILMEMDISTLPREGKGERERKREGQGEIERGEEIGDGLEMSIQERRRGEEEFCFGSLKFGRVLKTHFYS